MVQMEHEVDMIRRKLDKNQKILSRMMETWSKHLPEAAPHWKTPSCRIRCLTPTLQDWLGCQSRNSKGYSDMFPCPHLPVPYIFGSCSSQLPIYHVTIDIFSHKIVLYISNWKMRVCVLLLGEEYPDYLWTCMTMTSRPAEKH